MLKSFLLVGLGGMTGSMLRYLFSVFIKSNSFPYATLSVNVIGSLVIGLVMGITMRSGSSSDNWKLFLATGICGGFTTFSAFSKECIELMTGGRYAAMFTYISLSIFLGLAATFAGLQLAKL